MSQISDPSRIAESDVQSKRSSEDINVLGGASSFTQRQTNQYGHTERSGHSEQKRIQRSNSSSSSSSSSSGLERGGGVRPDVRIEASGAMTEQQKFTAGAPNVQVGPSGGSYDVSGGSFGGGERRKARYRKEVIRLPDQPQGQVRQVRHRLPTPEPDTLERVYIQRTAAEIVEEITEIPMTPPPRIQERTVVEPAGPPQVVKRVIRVPPRGGYQQQQTGASFQQNANLSSSESYGTIQQVPSASQQQIGTTYSSGPAGAGFNLGPTGGTFGSGGANFGSGGANFGASFGSGGANFGAGFGSGGANFGAGFGSGGANFGAGGASFGSGSANFGAGGANFGSFSGFSQPPGPLVFSVNANGSQPLPGLGCQPAYCFYL